LPIRRLAVYTNQPEPTPTATEPVNATTAVGGLWPGADAMASFRDHFKAARYEEAKADALRALAASPGNPVALVALQQACEALARQPRPESVPQCTYIGTNLRPVLPRTDPAVVNALQKILIDNEKIGPLGGAEEAEPKEDNARPAPRR
jgi:hypothetical protein